MLVEKNILDGDVPPRRVWDLHANRVVPWWVARKCPWPISHAWVDDKDLKREMSPINGYQWPVPMPKDADLNLIRIEMLNFGAEYIWLDVLCLRQKGEGSDPRDNPSKEEWERRELLRREEWKVDLPTIGWVYHNAEKVVYYFSGLGLPLSFKPGDFENDRCWFNRGWTLQETRDNLLIAGEARKLSDDGFMTGHMQKLFEKKLASLRQMRREESIFRILSQMQKRKSTNPVDKVAGLVYLFYSQYIPIYDADQSEEDAWTELVSIAQDWFRADLFFLYPEPGNGKKFWHPSWEQVMTEVLPKSSLNKVLYNIKINRTKKGGDKYLGLRIDSCRVRGLVDEPSPEIPRCGKLDITSHLGRKHTFDVVANHAYPIPDGKYTLIGTAKHGSTMEGVIWVVGKEDGVRKKKFRKVSVLSMANKREEDKLWKLDVHRYTKTPLL
ncbi:uncharacterized protein EV420DRAFT_1309817 [Desarmillaria tabescens]|uniref:Heterokaryon incompatibility domain-containing protein n=1 Tax=Armillaria tabescens TaxID=1929756 RepID=A0AA39N479_ARMTA|nr:uncharacterized protein EV420DRAFT_1309817 [Desarmillaria tabescens]KAK0457576.1 hypothetical protein EV420DRAFT_1309817 [Desarmillaria tabescens]